MSTVLLLIHVMVAVALVGVILLQRSEGGALGIGGGGGGFMTGRSAGNALTKTTAILAAGFFATSLALSLLAGQHGGTPSILNPAGQPGGLAPLQGPTPPSPGTPAPQSAPSAPQAPLSK
jgi:preprotein translocase subunit SecG